MKKRLMILTSFCVTVFACLAFLSSAVFATSMEIDLNQAVSVVQGMYDDYTDSDNLLAVPQSQVNKKVNQYKNDIFTQFVNADIVGDNPIVQIIPRELFVHRGEYFYVGAEYGFFVNTRANTTLGNVSTVFVFDLSYDLTLAENDLRLCN